MNLEELADILEATIHHGDDEAVNDEVSRVVASDLMSDILARDDTPDVLLTGLNTVQIVHTASISGIKAVVIARGKTPLQSVIDRAVEENIVLMSTKIGMFEASGRLYAKGLYSSAAE